MLNAASIKMDRINPKWRLLALLNTAYDKEELSYISATIFAKTSRVEHTEYANIDPSLLKELQGIGWLHLDIAWKKNQTNKEMFYPKFPALCLWVEISIPFVGFQGPIKTYLNFTSVVKQCNTQFTTPIHNTANLPIPPHATRKIENDNKKGMLNMYWKYWKKCQSYKKEGYIQVINSVDKYEPKSW